MSHDAGENPAGGPLPAAHQATCATSAGPGSCVLSGGRGGGGSCRCTCLRLLPQAPVGPWAPHPSSWPCSDHCLSTPLASITHMRSRRLPRVQAGG